MVGSDGVGRAQFLHWNDILRHPFYLDIPLEMSFERSEEETIRTLIDLGDLDVLGLFDGLPMLSMFDEESFRDVADTIGSWLLLRTNEALLPCRIVQEPKGFLCVVGKDCP